MLYLKHVKVDTSVKRNLMKSETGSNSCELKRITRKKGNISFPEIYYNPTFHTIRKLDFQWTKTTLQ